MKNYRARKRNPMTETEAKRLDREARKIDRLAESAARELSPHHASVLNYRREAEDYRRRAALIRRMAKKKNPSWKSSGSTASHLRPPGEWKGWAPGPSVSGDPADFASAGEVAAMYGHAVTGGPFVFHPDGRHTVRAGWTRQADGRYSRTDAAASEAEANALALASIRARKKRKNPLSGPLVITHEGSNVVITHSNPRKRVNPKVKLFRIDMTGTGPLADEVIAYNQGVRYVAELGSKAGHLYTSTPAGKLGSWLELYDSAADYARKIERSINGSLAAAGHKSTHVSVSAVPVSRANPRSRR